MRKVNPTLWSQQQAVDAAQIWQQFFTDHHGEDYDLPGLSTQRYQVLHRIADTIGRSYTSVKYRLETQGAAFGANQRSASAISAEQQAERAARKEAENARSLTSEFFGDPPPGYSALDRRNGGAQR